MKLKDVVTLGNLLGGFGAVIALLHNRFDWACYLIYIAYVFDVLDGPIARLTGQFDTFGAHFDSACDFVVNSVCSSYIVYYAFYHYAHYPWWAAAFIAAWPISFGTMRQARSEDNPLSYPTYWLGLPRPVATLFLVALLQSSMFAHDGAGAWGDWGHALSAVLVIVLSVLHLSYFPFQNAKRRVWFLLAKMGAITFLVLAPSAALLGWIFLGDIGPFFDVVLFVMSTYIFLQWVTIPRDDLDRIKVYVAGGALVRPLAAKGSGWYPKTLFPFFEPRLTPEELASLETTPKG